MSNVNNASTNLTFRKEDAPAGVNANNAFIRYSQSPQPKTRLRLLENHLGQAIKSYNPKIYLTFTRIFLIRADYQAVSELSVDPVKKPDAELSPSLLDINLLSIL